VLAVLVVGFVVGAVCDAWDALECWGVRTSLHGLSRIFGVHDE